MSLKPNSRVDTIDQSNRTSKVATEGVDTVVINEAPTWLILLFGLLCGFFIPSPKEIANSIIKLFRRK